MASKRIDFISPGVRVNEIDNTGQPDIGQPVGPTVIMRTERGPGLKPVQVNSYEEFINIFGYPFPGGETGDLWRNGNKSAPSFGAYAAQAWLKNSTPLNVVRLLGAQHTNATTAGEAGWETQDVNGSSNGLGNTDSDGGAYGLFLIDSASAGTPITGTLAAVWYVNQGSITLSGTLISDPATTAENLTGTAALFESTGASREFKAIIKNSAGTTVKTTAFNFNESSNRFIRKVFNTNPTVTNPSTVASANREDYWLGPTFERYIDETLNSSSAGSVYGMILGLRGDDATEEGSDFRMSTQSPQTGWFISQDLNIVSGSSNDYTPEAMTNLFKFHGINSGEWSQKNLKISIEDLKPSSDASDPYGTFTVTIRMASDTDNAVRIVERFTGCNLNPASRNYLARKVGDRYHVWSDTNRRYREYGMHPNRSRFVRVEMATPVENGQVEASLLPFGAYGPVRHKGFTIVSGATEFKAFGDPSTSFTEAHVQGANYPIVRPLSESLGLAVNMGDAQLDAAFKFPAPSLRSNSNIGDLSSPTDAYFGITTEKSGSTQFDPSYKDMVLPLPAGYDSFAAGDHTEHAWVFSLDDISGSGDTHAAYNSGSRAAGTSLTAVHGDWKKVLDEGFDKFTVPLFGGFDGLDITEQNPFRNTLLEGGTETSNYAYNSIKRAIDAVSDREEVVQKFMLAPGITNTGLMNHMVNICDDREDSVGIIDLPGGYVPSHENTSDESSRLGSITDTVDEKITRGLVSSRAAAYYPWLLYADDLSGKTFWGPPSIAALGVLGYTQATAAPWFAAAGVNRANLDLGGHGGVKVVGVREKLLKKDRDKLFQNQINPIANLPGVGIAIWGQRSFFPSDKVVSRLDVRLMVDILKRELERMATNILFEKNVPRTWGLFRNRAEPFLRSVQNQLGISRFKLVLDETTTTPDLIDRNIMYAKLFVVPTESIEHVEIDLNLEGAASTFE